MIRENILDAMKELVKAKNELNNPPKKVIAMGDYLSNCDGHVRDAYEHITKAYDILLKEMDLMEVKYDNRD